MESIDIDRLLHNLETLQDLLYVKRLLLQKECTKLESLLKPWPLENNAKEQQREKLPVKGPVAEDIGVKVAADENQCQIDDEIAKADALLKKVERVRCTVNDHEVRDMCNIEGNNHVKRKSKTKAGISSDNHNTGEKEMISKMVANARHTSRGRTHLHPAKSHKTTYTSSYRLPKPQTSKARSKTPDTTQPVEDKTRKPMATPNNGPSTTGRESHITDTNVSSASEPRELRVDDAFTLEMSGSQLKVPRSLKVSTRLNRQLKGKLLDRTPAKLSMTSRLSNYYLSVEQLNT